MCRFNDVVIRGGQWNPSRACHTAQVPKLTGYKATRKSIVQVRREHRERVWRNSDVPPSWEAKGADRSLMRELLSQERVNPFESTQEP